ncbi:PEP-CTERM sorting domain-containing protein [Candidatus Poribacteria bacterium]|nr:PEP-CTERM sorting domain-containing protein [Candidatus Poribacteria bacterium]
MKHFFNQTRISRTVFFSFLLLSFAGLLPSLGFAGLIWELTQPLPTPRQTHNAVGTSNAVYVFGGNTGGSQTSGFTADAYKFSESSGSWTTIASMPNSVAYMGAAALGDDVYVIGGGEAVSSVYKYSPSSNSWTTVAALNHERRQAASVALGGFIYAVGGVTGSFSFPSNTSAVERYDPAANSWSDVASLPIGMAPNTVVAVGGYLYAVGGAPGRSAFRYSPIDDIWTSIADVPFDTWGNPNGSQILDGAGHITVFSTDLTQYATYDPISNTWTVFPTTPNVSHGSLWATAATSSYLYLLGGTVNSGTSERALITQPIPEPSTFVLFGIGILGILGYSWRRRKQARQ